MDLDVSHPDKISSADKSLNHRTGILNIGKYAFIIIVTKKVAISICESISNGKYYANMLLPLTFTFLLLINIAEPPACMSCELVEVESDAHGVSRAYFFLSFFFRRSENMCKYF